MKKFLATGMIFMFALFFASVAVFAAEKPSVQCNDEQIIIATGVASGTYSQMTKSVIKLNPELLCEYTDSTGGEQNINLLINRKVDAGLAQADVLDFLNRTEPMVKKKLRSLVSLHGSSMHVFVLRGGWKIKENYGLSSKTVKVTTLRDLRGQKVAVFASALITATIVNERLNLGMQIVNVEKYQDGLDKLKLAEVAAFLAMGGKPIGWAEKLDGNIFTLANVDASDIQALGSPYYPVKLTYRNMGVVGANAITARNDLVVWDYTGKRAEKLVALRKFIKDNLNDIKETRGSHPSWQDVEDDKLEEVAWTLYQPSGVAVKEVAKKRKK